MFSDVYEYEMGAQFIHVKFNLLMMRVCNRFYVIY